VSDPRRGAVTGLRGAAADEAYPLDAVFGALSDPIRRGMLAQLAQGLCSVSELGKPFPVSAPAISKHLSVLERSGLIERWKVGRVHFCRLITAPLQQAGDWIAQHQAFWESQLDALENYLDRDEEGCREQSNKPTSPSISDAISPRRPRKSSARGHNRKR
jgi:DNA-binding transcriptional ArsR family regulator